MILVFSGGGTPWVPEMQLENPAVMPSFWWYCSTKGKLDKSNPKPDARFRKLLKARIKSKKKGRSL